MVKLRYSDKAKELVWMLCYRYKGEERCVDFFETRQQARTEAEGLDSDDLLDVYIARVEEQIDDAATKKANANKDHTQALPIIPMAYAKPINSEDE